jgi:multiple sugar transport system ATP-binding protein
MSCVAIERLSKVFKGPKGENIQAVKDANLTVEKGEFLVLVGPSGCGKSTTLRMIAGLEDITSGSISIDGQVVNSVPPKDRDIAMVFQNYALYPHMTVFDNMAFGLKLRKYPRAEIEERVGKTADVLGLRDCLNRKPQELSGGQRQRVAVGRAIVRQPKVFLFDEPLSNLDAQMRVQLRREISTLHNRLGATMIYVTHDQVEAMTMGDRIVVMRDGVIQQVADPMTLYRQPANMFVAGFIGSPPMNFFRGTIARRNGALLFHEDNAASKNGPGFAVTLSPESASRLAAYDAKKIVLGLRPEHITDQRAVNVPVIDALTEVIEPLGAETYLYASTGAHSLAARIKNTHKPGDKIQMSFDMTRALYFDPATEKTI